MTTSRQHVEARAWAAWWGDSSDEKADYAPFVAMCDLASAIRDLDESAMTHRRRVAQLEGEAIGLRVAAHGLAGAIEYGKVRRVALRLKDCESLRADFNRLAAPVPVLIVVTGFQERAG